MYVWLVRFHYSGDSWAWLQDIRTVAWKEVKKQFCYGNNVTGTGLENHHKLFTMKHIYCFNMKNHKCFNKKKGCVASDSNYTNTGGFYRDSGHG